MATYNYVDTVNLCCICRMPFCEPLTTRTCCHTFCRECISTALDLSQHCPIDRSPLVINDLLPADPLLRNLVDELHVECPMQSAGCSFIGQRQLLESHLKDNCLYVSVPCLEDLCKERVLRKDAEHNVHASQIEPQYVDGSQKDAKSVNCDDCLLSLSPGELVGHKATCPDVLVDCDQATHGCEWNGPRRAFTAHISTCPYQAIKGYFAINDKKMLALSEENSVLRQRITALDGIITSLRREVAAVKSILGPWYCHDRQTMSRALVQQHRFSDSITHAGTVSQADEAIGASDIGSFMNIAEGNSRSSASNQTLAEADDLSSYFPAVEPDGWLPVVRESQGDARYSTAHSAAVHQPAQPTSANRTSTLSYTPYSQNQTSAYAAIPMQASASLQQSLVAPLDLSTSLEGSLLGLRDSVVTLSAALDSASRRQDVALTTESMRTAEEIRSLRAVIHGLRMQVHSIIMDRNAQATGRSGDDSIPPWMPDTHEHPMPWLRPPFQPRYPLTSIPSVSGSVPKL